jgi:CsoR family transcriptional regulator, copper-sensing transcriptional repressor
MQKILHRLHRMEGQLKGIEEALTTKKTCEDIIPQLLAVKGSLDGLINAYLETSLDSCVETKKMDSMRNIIKTLIKNT